MAGMIEMLPEVPLFIRNISQTVPEKHLAASPMGKTASSYFQFVPLGSAKTTT